MFDPAEKYKDKVDPAHSMAMEIVSSSYQMLKMVEPDLRKVDEAERQAHSVGHITDPTLYRDMIYSKSFAHQMKMIRAALKFIAELDAVKTEMEQN